MRTVFVVVAVALTLTAAAFSQEYEPNWGEKVEPDIEYEPNQPVAFWGAAWSPDGTMMAVLDQPETIVIFSVEEGNVLYEYSVQPPNYMGVGWLWFTPDGTELTFTARKLLPEGQELTWYLVNFNLDTEEIREITPGQYPVWSPSGRYLCYCMKYDNDEQVKRVSLMVYDTETETTTTLMEIPGEYNDGTGVIHTYAILRPSFLPDESAVIFPLRSEETDGKELLYRIPLTGGSPEEIIVRDAKDNQYECPFIAVHPDGRHVVVAGEIPDSKSILLWVDMDTGIGIPLIPGDGEYTASYPAISMDGMKVCFTYGPELRILELDESLFDGGFQTAVESEIPAAFPTLASHPNPFNTSTTITFTLPVSGFTELSVYNLAGQKIRTLVAGELSPGIHEVVWDGCDDSGHPVSSGIFVSRLKTGDSAVTSRMTLVK